MPGEELDLVAVDRFEVDGRAHQRERPAAVVAQGATLFREGEQRKLKLVTSTPLPTGVVALSYEPVR